MSVEEKAIALEGVEVRRAGQVVLQQIDLSIAAGQSLAILGRNGAGKTTLAETIAGLLRASAGSLSLFGRDITRLRAHEVARLGVSLVPEGRALFPNMTVRDNLAMGAHTTKWLWGGPPPAAFETVWALFPALVELGDRKAGSLSGGQQQMVAVGRALMSSPKLLVLDEPSAGLSPQAVDAMMDRLKVLAREGYSMVVIEQNADLALEVCSEVAILAGGKIAARGPGNEVTKQRLFVEALFGDVPAGTPSLTASEP